VTLSQERRGQENGTEVVIPLVLCQSGTVQVIQLFEACQDSLHTRPQLWRPYLKTTTKPTTMLTGETLG